MTVLVLDAQPRNLQEKARHLRQAGQVPAIVYGPARAPFAVQLAEKGLEGTLRQAGTMLVKVNVGNDSHNVMVKEVQRHPVNHRITHVDFYLVRMDQKQQVAVQLVPVGRPASLIGGMMVLQNYETVEIEALPAAIPAVIEVDVTNLKVDQPITVHNLPALDGIAYLTDPDAQLISLVAAQAGLEAETAEEEAGTPAEPELLKKGKTDEEGDE